MDSPHQHNQAGKTNQEPIHWSHQIRNSQNGLATNLHPSNLPFQTTPLTTPPPDGLQDQQQPKPKRRRYRIPRSCDRCRASKIKCVFQDGHCVACAHARVACTFANPGSLKERPPTQKDVEHLQARIRSLERLIHAIDPALDLSALPEPFQPSPLHSNSVIDQFWPSASTLIPSQPSQSFLETHDPQSDPALSSIFFPSQLKLNVSPGHSRLPSANVNGLTPVDKIIRQEFAKKIHWRYSPHPEPELEQHLIQLYFKNIHPGLSLIHPPTFMRDLQSGLSNKDESFRALCLSIMAVSSRFSKDPRVFLNLDGHPQHSLQAAGLRYALIVTTYLFQPIAPTANIYDLQTALLIVIYALGAVSPDAAWNLAGLGLQRAQETGAHLENSPQWTSSPLLDHLRRKAFTMLYEFDFFLSAAIGKPPYMQESDFDVLPHDIEFDVTIGTFTNPFGQSAATNSEGQEEMNVANDLSAAYFTLKSSIGGIKNLFPLMDVMNVRKRSYPGVKFSSCVELLINQLDASLTKCYGKIAQKFGAYESSNATVTDYQLLSSVNAVTWYHEIRLLTHKALMGIKRHKKKLRKEAGSPSNNSQESISKAMVTNSHEICIKSARMILILIDRLHQRNLSELGFYWIPLRVTNALIVLIVSLHTYRKLMSEDQRNARLYEISLGIQMLNVLAPSTFIAGKCSKMMIQFQQYILHKSDQQSSKKSTPSSSASPPTVI